jgi:hypothetical protein
MEDARARGNRMRFSIIYQDQPDRLRHRPNSSGGEMINHGPRKVIGFTDNTLVVQDCELGVGIDIPVSHWKLFEIGLNCILTSFERR